MTVLVHPDFPKDIRRFEMQYARISLGLAARFRAEIDQALEDIKHSPRRTGHLLNSTSPLVKDLRRRNLRAFPFFVLYGIVEDRLIIASVIPSRSDPLTWLTRF